MIDTELPCVTRSMPDLALDTSLVTVRIEHSAHAQVLGTWSAME